MARYRSGKEGPFLAVLAALLLAGFIGCSGGSVKVVPEMQELIDNFANTASRDALLVKFGARDLVPENLRKCDFTKPILQKSEVKEGVTMYTMESRVEKCDPSPTAVGTVRIFTLGWKDGKIVSFECHGPKSGKVEY